ncbi:MAG: NUDIX hydrolase [Melioribacteraceae bacterium]|nr:NUDIX hydrolase [Melioribacteraceae bacterium]MCF8355698.1 NUDIX hydrolase [Melioribacteraceae bacterium]MCF8394428.1 NUDIX hydrolase [Melioribacteraceae bacterium]MCF8418562.1 NUDIX hydrolase [Melioribacteraceae bacterium]
MSKKPDYFYNQSAVIPYKIENNEISILIITSAKKKRWVIPKGIIEDGMKPSESALKEAIEEAGVSGNVAKQPVGIYKYDKWGGTCTVEVFPMEVKKVFERWDEDFRDRLWIKLSEVENYIEENDLLKLIQKFSNEINGS